MMETKYNQSLSFEKSRWAKNCSSKKFMESSQASDYHEKLQLKWQ